MVNAISEANAAMKLVGVSGGAHNSYRAGVENTIVEVDEERDEMD
jgi:hypothetical protein